MQAREKVDPEILLKHAKKWVAFTPDRMKIVAVGQTPQAVESKLKDQQISDAILHYVPAPDRALHSILAKSPNLAYTLFHGTEDDPTTRSSADPTRAVVSD